MGQLRKQVGSCVDGGLAQLIGAICALQHGGMLLVATDPHTCGVPLRKIDIDLGKAIREVAYRRELYQHRCRSGANDRWMLEEEPQLAEVEKYALRLSAEVIHTQVERDLRATMRQVARLSTIDGAIIADYSLKLTGFGLKVSPDHRPQLECVEPTAKGDAKPFALELHGTRHKAAALFANDDPGNLALLVSQDGPAKAVFKRADSIVFWPLEPAPPWVLT